MRRISVTYAAMIEVKCLDAGAPETNVQCIRKLGRLPRHKARRARGWVVMQRYLRAGQRAEVGRRIFRLRGREEEVAE